MNETETTHQEDARQRGHEPNTVSVRKLLVSGTSLVLMVALALPLMYGTLGLLASRQQPGTRDQRLEVNATIETSPSVSDDQPQRLRELRQREARQLNTYEWIDEPSGVARIPISRAIEIVSDRGLAKNESNNEEQPDDVSP